MKHQKEFLPIDFFTQKRVICVLFLLCVSITGYSCKNDSGPTMAPLVESAGIDQFPMSVGDTWTYIAYDSLANTVDTVSVEIAAAPLKEHVFTNIWVFSGRRYNDTLYALVNGNTLLMYDDPLATQLSTTIQFPLETGSSWGTVVDSNVVRAESNVVVPAGVLGRAFRIDRHAWGLNYGLDSRTWIVAGVGIAKLERKEINLGPVFYQRWDLLRFRHVQ